MFLPLTNDYFSLNMQTFKVIFKHVQLFFIHDKEKGEKDISSKLTLKGIKIGCRFLLALQNAKISVIDCLQQDFFIGCNGGNKSSAGAAEHVL